MRLKAFAGPFGVCYQVVTRTTWQLVALSDSHLNSISLHKAAAAVAPSRATTRCPASLLASRRTYTALYRIYPLQRLSRYKIGPHRRAHCRLVLSIQEFCWKHAAAATDVEDKLY